MTTLVLGATGATGRRLVAELLARGESVRAIVRSSERLTPDLREHPQLEVSEAPLLDIAHDELVERVRGCRAIASCLGHNLSLRGVFGPPRRLVLQAVRRTCRAIEATEPKRPVRYVLLGSAGVRNRGLDESTSAAQRAIVALLTALVPAHADNEAAAEYLRATIGGGRPEVEWSVVRPDGLTNEDSVTPYDVYESPIRSAIFDAGQTSRVNVAHFMAELITCDAIWSTWRGQMPVVYNRVRA